MLRVGRFELVCAKFGHWKLLGEHLLILTIPISGCREVGHLKGICTIWWVHEVANQALVGFSAFLLLLLHKVGEHLSARFGAFMSLYELFLNDIGHHLVKASLALMLLLGTS